MSRLGELTMRNPKYYFNFGSSNLGVQQYQNLLKNIRKIEMNIAS